MNKLVEYIKDNWHRVPDDAIIPAEAEFAYTLDNAPGWVLHANSGEVSSRRRPSDGIARYTPEPLPEPEPAFVLPTEPGSVVIAHTEHRQERRVFIRVADATLYPWRDGNYHWTAEQLIDPEPARVVPNGIGVMDEDDYRDVIDSRGRRWVWWCWVATWRTADACVLQRGTKAAIARDFGPLRFADEEAE